MAIGWVSPNNGEEVIAEHVSQITNSSAGVPGGGQIWKLNQLDDAANPALSIRNVNAAGTALRVYETTSGVDTDWLTVVNGVGVVMRGLYQQGPQIYDVEAYGAVGNGTTDDTAAIQACIAAVKTYQSTSGYSGATIRFNSLQYAVSALNCSGLSNIHFLGASSIGTQLRATKQTAAVHGAGGKAVFDGTATFSCSWSDINVDASQIPVGSISPMAGWMFAGTGTFGVNCTANRMTNCGTFGAYQVASVITLYSSDHLFVGCGWQQWKKDRPCILVGSADPGTVGTITSLTTDTFPPSTYSGGGGDLTFVGCEAHHMPASSGASAPYNTGQGHTLDIQAALSVRWYGGNMASYGSSVIRIGGGTQGVVINGAQCYSDDAGHQASFLVLVDGTTPSVNGLVLHGLNLNSILADSGNSALIRLGAEATLSNVSVIGLSGSYPTAALAVSAGGYASAATQCLSVATIECGGHGLNLNSASHGPSIGGAVTLILPGTVTMDAAAVDYSQRIGPDYLAINNGNTRDLPSTGTLRMGEAFSITTRNVADSADLTVLATDASDIITIGTSTGVSEVRLNAANDVRLRLAGTDRIVINTTGLGFNNATPVAKPTVTGSRGANAALASVLTALSNLGLITDSSS